MSDLTERLIALREHSYPSGYPVLSREYRALLTEAVNRLTELEAECEHLRAKGLAEHGGRYEQFERAERLREALEASVEALHDLNDDHLDHTFTDCPNWRCVAARAALRPGVSEGATDSAGIASLPVERSAENPGHGPNQPDRPLADSERSPTRRREAMGEWPKWSVTEQTYVAPFDLARELYEAAVEHLDKGRRPRIIAAVKRYEQEVGE